MTPDNQNSTSGSQAGALSDPDRFDPDYYLRANDDVRAFGFDPADHYFRFGRAEGRPANAMQAARRYGRLAAGRNTIDVTPFLTEAHAVAAEVESVLAEDPTLANHPAVPAYEPDAAASEPAGPADDQAGESDPPGWFDAEWYLGQNRDVRHSRLDPYTHYREHGFREGRPPNRAIAKVGRLGFAPRSLSPEQQAAAIAVIAQCGLLDADWYGERYGIEAALAVQHYVAAGAFLGNDPSPFFSSLDYIKANPDILNAGANPLAHYVEYGFMENRGGVKTLSETRLTTRVWLKGL